MSNNIKLLKWGELFSKSLPTDKAVAILTEGDVSAQDRADVIEALSINESNVTKNVVQVDTITYEASPSDRYIIADDIAAEDVITITLPSADDAGSGCTISVKKIGDIDNVVVDPAEGESIDGGTVTLLNQYDYVTVVSDGTTWWVF
jgi:hypothetical protein